MENTKGGRGGDTTIHNETTHDSSNTTVLHSTTRRQYRTHHRTSPPTTRNRRGNRTTEKGTKQHEGTPTQRRGTALLPRPAIQHGHRANERGGIDIHERGTPTLDGRATAITPRPSSLCHPLCYGTPPSTMAPPSTTVRGERTEDTPPHEQHRHTPTTRTPHTWRGTVRDMTAVLASTAVG